MKGTPKSLSKGFLIHHKSEAVKTSGANINQNPQQKLRVLMNKTEPK